MSIAAIVLAAGGSRRMGHPKALLPIGATTFLGRIVATVREAGLEAVHVIVGDDAMTIAVAHPELARSMIHNVRPDLGPLSSLRLGVAALAPNVDGAVVFPVDHPLVQAATVRALVGEFRRLGRPIVVPIHAGQRGHPTLFARETFAELATAPLEAGARAVVRADPARVAEVEVDDPGILANVDTPEAYRELIGDGRAG